MNKSVQTSEDEGMREVATQTDSEPHVTPATPVGRPESPDASAYVCPPSVEESPDEQRGRESRRVPELSFSDISSSLLMVP